jgi:hypothetical protein
MNPGVTEEASKTAQTVVEALKTTPALLALVIFRVMRLYEVWTSDPRDQPGRAATGTRNAIRAYVNSRRFMEQWNPPACS